MPCNYVRSRRQTAADRKREIERALAELERKLRERAVNLEIGRQGAVVFKGWRPNDRGGVSDVCAYRRLAQAGSWELRQAIKRAEARSGRRVNPQAVASGLHSHDGGETWARD
jgi:hypothetical protein